MARSMLSAMVDTKLIKSAGEHWVAGVLSDLGWAAALTRDGIERTDLLAVHSIERRMIEVQVKTAGHMSKPNWRVNEKAQRPARSDREWFVFVALAATAWEAPRGFVVPRDHVAAAAWIRHMDWLSEPGIPKGQRNAPVQLARIQDWVIGGYENRWDLLDRPAGDVPVLLPQRFRELATSRRVGLPPDHPWLDRLPDR
jgi:hypothetical protein